MEQSEQETTLLSGISLRELLFDHPLPAKCYRTLLLGLLKSTRKQERIKKSNQTVNLELACLKTLFAKAITWGKATENPVKQVKMLRVNNARVRFLDETEEARLLVECKEYLYDLVVTALHTGFRRNELLSLRSEDVDFARGLVSVRAGYAKNGEGRSIPMSTTVKVILRQLVEKAEATSSPYLFRNCHGEPYRSCRSAFEYVVQKVGIKDFHFHDLRHTFASRLVMAGVDIVFLNEMSDERRSCFDKLSTNGKSLTISAPNPFALSLSKGGGAFFSPSQKGDLYKDCTRVDGTQNHKYDPALLPSLTKP